MYIFDPTHPRHSLGPTQPRAKADHAYEVPPVQATPGRVREAPHESTATVTHARVLEIV